MYLAFKSLAIIGNNNKIYKIQLCKSFSNMTKSSSSHHHKSGSKHLKIEKNKHYLKLIKHKVKKYEIKVLEEFRPGKKLLVLDLDRTIFDNGRKSERPPKPNNVEEDYYDQTNYRARPGLHQLLSTVYEHYDIIIWSAGNMDYIKNTLKWLKIHNKEPTKHNDANDYKIAFYMDGSSRINIKKHTKWVRTKPLGVIWGKYKQYSSRNTIMVDDKKRNFWMNYQCGLRIKPFKRCRRESNDGSPESSSYSLSKDDNGHLIWKNDDHVEIEDRELYHLCHYLVSIAHIDDFRCLTHPFWEKNPRRKRPWTELAPSTPSSSDESSDGSPPNKIMKMDQVDNNGAAKSNFTNKFSTQATLPNLFRIINAFVLKVSELIFQVHHKCSGGYYKINSSNLDNNCDNNSGFNNIEKPNTNVNPKNDKNVEYISGLSGRIVLHNIDPSSVTLQSTIGEDKQQLELARINLNIDESKTIVIEATKEVSKQNHHMEFTKLVDISFKQKLK